MISILSILHVLFSKVYGRMLSIICHNSHIAYIYLHLTLLQKSRPPFCENGTSNKQEKNKYLLFGGVSILCTTLSQQTEWTEIYLLDLLSIIWENEGETSSSTLFDVFTNQDNYKSTRNQHRVCVIMTNHCDAYEVKNVFNNKKNDNKQNKTNTHKKERE